MQWHILQAEEEKAKLRMMRESSLAQAVASVEVIKQERLQYERQ